MRIVFGILSLCAAGLIACHVVPMMHQFVLPCWLRGKCGGGFIQMGFGSIQLEGQQICIFEAVLVLLVIALLVIGIYAFTRDTTA